MSATTSIEWTDRTWNPVTGCTKVSAGCKNCYAERIAKRVWGNRKFTDVRVHPERMKEPRRWREPQRVFVNSMSDLFHEAVPDGFIAWVWHVMAHHPHLTFQILTKRPQRMLEWCRRWADRSGDDAADTGRDLPPMPRGPDEIRATYTSGRARLFADMLEQWGLPPAGAAFPLYDWAEGPRFWPGDSLPNVWLGVSCENQESANERVPLLLQTPAAVRFLSCEPLLGPIELNDGYHSWLTCKAPDTDDVCCDSMAMHGEHYRGIDWVIVGGESGPGRRTMDLDCARSLAVQCAHAGIAFFFKQGNGHKPGMHQDALGEHIQEFPR